MNQPCPDRANCVCADESPFLNLSSADPDLPVFKSVAYIEQAPPLGVSWDRWGCVGRCESTVSQEAADLCAVDQGFQCFTDTWFLPGPGLLPPGPPPQQPSGNQKQPTFRNTQQTATTNCPDGNPFTFKVPAGVFSDITQNGANLKAQSFAQQKALERIICLSNLVPSQICANVPYSATITATGKFLSNTPAGDLWIITGNVPPGIDIDEGFIVGGTIHLTGTPTNPGIYRFVVSVGDSLGDDQVKSYTIRVMGITNGNLFADGTVGTVYHQDVNAAGVTNAIFSLESGALPDGLSLDGGGIIFGTPTANGDFDFTLGVTEAGTGLTCNTDCSIHVDTGINWNQLVWTTPDVPPGNPDDPFGTFQNNNFNIPSSGWFNNQLNNSASMPFDGGPVACNLQITITALGVDYNPNPFTTEIDITIQDSMLNTYLTTVGTNWAAPGVYNIPFNIPALTAETLTLTMTVACQNGNPDSAFAVTALITPAS